MLLDGSEQYHHSPLYLELLFLSFSFYIIVNLFLYIFLWTFSFTLSSCYPSLSLCQEIIIIILLFLVIFILFTRIKKKLYLSFHYLCILKLWSLFFPWILNDDMFWGCSMTHISVTISLVPLNFFFTPGQWYPMPRSTHAQSTLQPSSLTSLYPHVACRENLHDKGWYIYPVSWFFFLLPLVCLYVLGFIFLLGPTSSDFFFLDFIAGLLCSFPFSKIALK